MTDDRHAEDDADSPTGNRLASTLSTMEFRRDRVVLWALAVALIGVLGYLAWRYVGTFVLGLFVYYVTRPVFQRIHGQIESRTLAVVVSLATIALPVLVLLGWTLSIAFQALSDFLDSDSPGQFEDLIKPYVDVSEFLRDVDEIVRDLLADPSQIGTIDPGPFVSGLTDTILSSLGVLFNVGIHGFVVLVIAFYLLRDDHRVAKWARGTFIRDGGVLESYFRAVDRDLKNVYFGNILNALFTGILAATTYVLLNTVAPEAVRIPQAAFLGLLVGAASLVPVIGIKLVWVPVALILIGRAVFVNPALLWFPVVFALVSVVVVDYIPDQLLRPYVSGRTLHVGAVMLAYTLGPLLFGWYGIFLAPFILVVVFEFARIIFPWLVAPEGAEILEFDDDGSPPSTEADSTPGARTAGMVSESASTGDSATGKSTTAEPTTAESAIDAAVGDAPTGADGRTYDVGAGASGDGDSTGVESASGAENPDGSGDPPDGPEDPPDDAERPSSDTEGDRSARPFRDGDAAGE